MKIWLVLCLVLVCQYSYSVAGEDDLSEEVPELRCSGGACAGTVQRKTGHGGLKGKGGGQRLARPTGNKGQRRVVGKLANLGQGGGSGSSESGIRQPVQRGRGQLQLGGCESVQPVRQVRPVRPVQRVRPVQPVQQVRPVQRVRLVKQVPPVRQVRPVERVRQVQQVKRVPVKRGPVRNEVADCEPCPTNGQDLLSADPEESEKDNCS